MNRNAERLDKNKIVINNQHGIPAYIIANDQVPIENQAIDEAISLLNIADTIKKLKTTNYFDNKNPEIEKLILTPDFHKGSGIPIGTVLKTKDFIIPQAIGSDINCGMRLIATSLSKKDIDSNADKIEEKLRYTFFEGGRNIPMKPIQREAILREGMNGLLETKNEVNQGIWNYINQTNIETNKIHAHGAFKTNEIFALDDYVRCSGGIGYDSIIGSVGGGNHFVEVQYVKKILDHTATHKFGLKEGQIVIMAHSGSLSLGHQTKNYIIDVLKKIYPSNLAHPINNIYLLPYSEKFSNEFNKFIISMHNAANFAYCNRFFLTSMVTNVLNSLCEMEFEVIYDAPHNLAWRDQNNFIHRKGATPANGPSEENDFYGEPVIVPGSMGSSSYLLLGLGNEDVLCSACHGAGRKLSRGSSMKVSESELNKFLKEFRVITPIDHKNPSIKSRRDIIDKWKSELMQEAPWAYKDITPVIQTLNNANIARPVVELHPLMTVKG